MMAHNLEYDREYSQKYRDDHPKEIAHKRRSQSIATTSKTPFAGVDGEGATINGRHEYMMLRAGTELLFTGKPLGPRECLEFLADLDPGFIYVSFFFDYDVTMMLRDLREDRVRHLLDRSLREWEPVNLPEWDLQIEWLPKKSFKVRKAPHGKWIEVSDTSGFFQTSFVKALDLWQVGSQTQRDSVARLKEQRADFTGSEDEIRYNALECELLAEMMEAVRDTCTDLRIKPRKWQGAGQIASDLYLKHKSPRVGTNIRWPAEVGTAANMGYYGGRFEITKLGQITGPVYEYDINSAYPAAMTNLPCLMHGQWRNWSGKIHEDGLYFLTFEGDGTVCPFPIRQADGAIMFPRQGRGWYWGWEAQAASAAGWQLDIEDGWEFWRDCDCDTFGWVDEIYRKRKAIGSSEKGIVLKLGLNSLYGKTAQRIGGGGPYTNMVYAGMITSQTRAMLFNAAAQKPDSILMMATDGIYSTEPLHLPTGDALGEWELKVMDGVFLVQPGVYLPGSGKLPKTRGVPQVIVTDQADNIRAAWERGDPSVTLTGIRQFIGLKLAYARNKPEIAGTWIAPGDKLRRDCKTIMFDPSSKRQPFFRSGGVLSTEPYESSAQFESVYYDRLSEVSPASDRDVSRWMQENFDSQPDFVPLLAHRM